MRGLSLVAASGGHSSLRCAGLSLSRPLLLWSTGSRSTGSVIVAHGPSCSTTCGIFQTRTRAHVPCIGRWILNHCSTREVLYNLLSFLHLKVLAWGASLVAQWLRICLPMQGTRVRALVWEDPTCHGATRPVSHNY